MRTLNLVQVITLVREILKLREEGLKYREIDAEIGIVFGTFDHFRSYRFINSPRGQYAKVLIENS